MARVPGWLCARTYSGQNVLKLEEALMPQRLSQAGDSKAEAGPNYSPPFERKIRSANSLSNPEDI
jgi:hypothetical protein